MSLLAGKHLSVFGIGPIYVGTITLLTILGIGLSIQGRLPFIALVQADKVFFVLGIGCIILGIVLWLTGALFSKLNQSIKNNQLVTGGIYAFVRNPIYSAFMFLLTGMILIYANILLFILPCFYWLLMTVLLKVSEEKWLSELYGEKYLAYCKRVNRCLPWYRG